MKSDLEIVFKKFDDALNELNKTIEKMRLDNTRTVNQDLPPLFHHKGGPDNDQ